MVINWQIFYTMFEQENLFAMIYSGYDTFGPEIFFLHCIL